MPEQLEANERDTLLSEDVPTENSTDQPRVILKRKVIVEPLMFLYFMGLMASSPLTTQYLYYRIGKKYGFDPKLVSTSKSECGNVNKSDPIYLAETKTQEEASQLSMYFTFANMTPAIIMTLVLGAQCDRFGRKPCVLFPCIGSFIKSLLSIIIVNYEWSLNLFFIGSVIEGSCGYYATMLMGCSAFIADTTTKRQRAIRITAMEVFVGMGIAASQIGIGYWIQYGSFMGPTIFICAMFTVATIYAILLVPETVRKDASQKWDTMKTLFGAVLVFRKRPQLMDTFKLRMLLAILWVVALPVVSVNSLDNLYLLGSPLCFTSVMIGFFLAAVAVITQIGSMCGIVVFKKMGLRECTIVLISACSGCATYALYSVAYAKFVVYIAAVCALFKFLSIPVIRAMMSKTALPSEQGAVFASIAAIESFCTLVGSIIFSEVYSHTQTFYRGTIYVIITGFYITGIILLVIYKIKTMHRNIELKITAAE